MSESNTFLITLNEMTSRTTNTTGHYCGPLLIGLLCRGMQVGLLLSMMPIIETSMMASGCVHGRLLCNRLRMVSTVERRSKLLLLLSGRLVSPPIIRIHSGCGPLRALIHH